MALAAVPNCPAEADERTSLLNHGRERRIARSSDLEQFHSTRGMYVAQSMHGYDSKHATTHEEATLGIFQILLLCYARLMEPIAFFSIFPYIAQMVQENGNLPDSDVGFYSGLVESVFAITQALFMMPWSNLADRIGRKPVILASLIGMGMGQVLFGMTTTLWQMILVRSVTGVFSSANPIIRTMIGEGCSPGKQASAFSLYSTAGNIALFLGPVIGGMLVHPAGQYPAFSGVELLEQHPYLLSCVAVGLMNATAVICLAIFLREPAKKNKDSADDTAGLQIDDTGAPSAWQIMWDPEVFSALLTYAYVVFVAFSFTTILPVALYTPVGLGGFGYSAPETSIFMTLQGASETVWLLLIFPALQHRIGTYGIIRLCALGFPCMFCGYILMNALLRNGDATALALSDSLVLVLELVGPALWMSFTATQLSLNDASPSPRILSKINSLAEMASSLIRSVVPAAFSAVFAIGVRQQLLSGYFGWVILILLSAPLLGTWRL